MVQKRLSIFTTISNPDKRGDPYKEAMACYKDLADEVVIINGGGSMTEHLEFTYVNYKWKEEFSWPFIGQQFTRGYNACTGDVVIHADLDFIWHEKDFGLIKAAAETMLNDNLPAMSMWKYQFILPDRYNLKSRIVTMVNKRDFGSRIKFDSGGDLTQPSLDGEYINPNYTPESKVPIYNYEKMLKTEEQIKRDQGRMERAWFRHFGKYQMGSDGSDDNALERWITAQIGKYQKPQKSIELNEHPKYIQETIKNLKPKQWGYNGFGRLR